MAAPVTAPQLATMKLITFCVPSYNSQDYLNICVDSLLVGGDDVEIIIVNDGSTDNTAQIADAYAEKYPSIIKVVHKQNGGHGSGVNAGLERAEGLYYKVVDSDDHLDADALKELLRTIKSHVDGGCAADLYITNFIYDHVEDGTQYISRYGKKLPTNKFFGWEQTKPLKLWKMFLMHSLTYKTELLKRVGVRLPEHTFYVDNIFAYVPLPYAESIYYLDVNLYIYLIGRPNQSVTIDNVVKRYDQQIRVMSLIFKAHGYDEIMKMCKPLRGQIFHYLDVMLMNTYFFTTAKDSPERREKFKAMWQEFKESDYKLYRRLRRMTKVRMLDMLGWKITGKITTANYKFLCRHVKLG